MANVSRLTIKCALVAGAVCCLFATARQALLAGVVTNSVGQYVADEALIHESLRQASPWIDPDADCPFKNSTIYRKVFVYPSPGEEGWSGDILSEYGRTLSFSSTRPHAAANATLHWPWLYYDAMARANGTSHYDIESQHVQYTTELLVRELMTNPRSCLRASTPEDATLFYVPYLPSMEFHRGSKTTNLEYKTSPYAQAILDILQRQDYSAWEQVFGLTSKYWRMRQGSDHILVFSEPFHGLLHKRNKRGHYHYIHTQQQTSSPIVISVELSTSFVRDYPKCARSNILMPYPNTDGRMYNGALRRQAIAIARAVQENVSQLEGPASDLSLPTSHIDSERPAAIFYSGGNHGTCPSVRRNLEKEVYHCSQSFQRYHKQASRRPHHGMWLSTFCPTPGGDSPSAKRMFDAVLMGCIPVVLSHDFVWPFTREIDPGDDSFIEATSFSVRVNAADFETQRVNYKTCQPIDPSRTGMLDRIREIPLSEIRRLQKGLVKAASMYSWYQPRSSLPDNPLRASVLPDGGAAHWLVRELGMRAGGVRWPSCRREFAERPWSKNATKTFRC